MEQYINQAFMILLFRSPPANRGRNGKKDVRFFLRPGKPGKANNLIINSLWIVFYVEWHQLFLRFKGRVAAVAAKSG